MSRVPGLHQAGSGSSLCVPPPKASGSELRATRRHPLSQMCRWQLFFRDSLRALWEGAIERAIRVLTSEQSASVCKHGIDIRCCAICKATATYGSRVFVSGGGSVFHSKNNCWAMEKGKRWVAERGGTEAETEWVDVGRALGENRQPCAICYRRPWRPRVSAKSLSADLASYRGPTPFPKSEYRVESGIAYRIPDSNRLHSDPYCARIHLGRTSKGPVLLIRMRRKLGPGSPDQPQVEFVHCRLCSSRHVHGSAVVSPGEADRRPDLSIENDAELASNVTTRPARFLLNENGKILMLGDDVSLRGYPPMICAEITDIGHDEVVVRFAEGGRQRVATREILARCKG